ncbi:MAG TPA: D-alanyl-D-alanine carboxypeptidase/D-alanyl-D-alanine-endopeptidase [Arachnia sp.]|nr:D-alanyl-D-alanine carboxypeptidase/D-alanyl-D-alanine-endopeptidase [Arachnia sp.]HMR12622.1 D-alanyl-D-alanine carboxypeptidase/D-alanyl-D-alanine-endopeptidase [Arachnia sp.]
MRSRRLWEWVVVGLLGGALLAAGFVGVVFRGQAFAALGLTRDGAPTSLPAGLLEPPQQSAPPEDDNPEPRPPETGLVAGAVAAEGPKPDPATLNQKLKALDRKKLKGIDDGPPVTVAYEVVDPATGKVVASSKADKPLIPASNTKTLTAIAVLSAFDGSETFATRVLQPEPGRIVLVGGGDPLLRSVPDTARPYPRPATTDELAAATAKALLAAGQKKVKLGFDASHFDEPGWNETWPSNYRDQVTQLSALWVDEGRLAGGGRSRTPAVDAAKTFAAQLKEHGVTVTGEPKKAKPKGDEVARVESLPVHVLMETAMNRSNNSFTEIMGLQLAAHTGHPSTFAGAVDAIEEQLKPLDLWDEGTVLHDASGLSRDNRVTTHTLARAVALVEGDRRLSVILDGLPTAGVTGTLADRFEDETSRPARGVARAKTGTLSLVSTLVGTTATADGRPLAFAFMINGTPDGWAAKVWMDQATGVVAACGCR